MYPKLAHWKTIQKQFDPQGIWQSDLFDDYHFVIDLLI